MKEFIKTLLKNRLFESKNNRKHDYGCVMLFLDVNKKDWKTFKEMIDKDDLYVDENDDSYGFETEPHITLLYGLHEDVPLEDVEEIIDVIGEPEFELKKVSSFDNDKYSVLKFDVVGKDLHKLNAKFRKLPHTNSYPDYHPHSTIAYIKPDKIDKYIKMFNDYIKENEFEYSIDKVVYSMVDGTKKNYKIKK